MCPARGVYGSLIIHVPHDSVFIPPDVRSQFLLNHADLQSELHRMTDHFTHDLFCGGVDAAQVVRAPVSRLVVDVERFPVDASEPMAAVGMGAVYASTSQLQPLRRALAPAEREALLRTWYHPHHAQLEQAVAGMLARHGRCLVVDCHSFPSVPLPYERGPGAHVRPDICIGTDAFHTSPAVAAAFTQAFAANGWSVALNQPFAGALVPASRYQQDTRVAAVMVEVNRRLYLHEPSATRHPDFATVAAQVRACWGRAVEAAGYG